MNALHETPSKNIAADIRSAASVGLLLALPFAVLEALFQTVNRQNAPGLALLFGLLWLLPATCTLALVPLVRTVRAGRSVAATPLGLFPRVAFAVLVAALWGAILIDQLPCFVGVPNCD